MQTSLSPRCPETLSSTAQVEKLLLAALLAVGLTLIWPACSREAASDRCFFRVRNIQPTMKTIPRLEIRAGLVIEEAIPANSRNGWEECAVDSHPDKY
jgi:hypothetical protein